MMTNGLLPPDPDLTCHPLVNLVCIYLTQGIPAKTYASPLASASWQPEAPESQGEKKLNKEIGSLITFRRRVAEAHVL